MALLGVKQLIDASQARKDREKSSKLGEDINRQREEAENEGNRILAQLVPGSREFTEMQNLIAQITSAAPSAQGRKFDLEQVINRGNELVIQQQDRIAAGGGATPLEERTDIAFQGLRDISARTPEEEDIFSILRGIDPTTDIGRIFQEALGFSQEEESVFGALRGTDGDSPIDQILQSIIGRAQDPDQFFQSNLDPSLQRARDFNAQTFADRGLLASGLQQEDLGRVGVDLAFNDARDREAFRQQQVSNADVLLQRGIGQTADRQSRAGSLFDVGQGLRGREIGLEEALTNLQLGREGGLTDLLRSQTGAATENQLELLGSRTTRSENLRDVDSALREAERQATEQFFAGLFDAGVGAATGGQFQTNASGSLQSAFGNAPTSAAGISGPQGSSQGSLLTAQRSPQGGTLNPNISSTLSRRQGSSTQGLEELLRTLASSGRSA